VGKNYPKFA